MPIRNQPESGLTDMFLSPSEIDARTCNVLLRLMSGMLLTLSGILMGLFVSSVAMASAGEVSAVSTLPWLVIFAFLTVALVIVAAGNQAPSALFGQPDGQNASVMACSASPSPDANGQARVGVEKFEHLLDQHIQRCAAESAPLAVIAIQADQDAGQHSSTLTQSLQGLARSRGALMLQSEGPTVVVLAPSQTSDRAQRLAEELHQSVISLALPCHSNELGVVTPSLGVVVAQPTRCTSPERLLSNLKQALEKAQQSGGNRIETISV